MPIVFIRCGVALDPIQPEASVPLGPYTRLNPNGKIPAIFDPMVRALYRSHTRDETIQWLKWLKWLK
ncbi:hypothetical protein CBA19CS42_36015 [Caballeronia novacaledonica]|uniref:Uncharacterized protein n=1 Tax=Caballeronia novacaledonica TaxID=1544861 RepID=A0AA37IND9_9BURK|nr:hypothetical protein CBA19CS42_36015 [Caballeronia novacaledonica]